MKKIFLFLLSFAVVLALAVIISPLIYPYLPFKFARIFNRIVMIGVLICVVIFVRIRKETFIEYGLTWGNESLRLLLTAFAAPVIVLSVYVAIQAFFGEAQIALRSDIGVEKWILRIIVAALTGLLIGTIEEFFFRGAVFNFTRNAFKNLFSALIVTNIFYSIVHFVHAKRPFIDSTPDFSDSLKLLVAPFASLTQIGEIWPGLIGLLIFGLMLSGLYLRTKSLYPSIGLHAGAVFFIKTDGLIVNFGNNNLLWGSGKMYDGFIGWGVLISLYLLLHFVFFKKGIINSRP